MNKLNKSLKSDHSPLTTRRQGLFTLLGTAIMLAGCGGGSVIASAGPSSVSVGADTDSITSDPGTPATSTLVLANNQIAVFGDSRSANATQNSTIATTSRVTAEAFIGYAMIASNFRGDFTGSYGINANTLKMMLDQIGRAHV